MCIFFRKKKKPTNPPDSSNPSSNVGPVLVLKPRYNPQEKDKSQTEKSITDSIVKAPKTVSYNLEPELLEQAMKQMNPKKQRVDARKKKVVQDTLQPDQSNVELEEQLNFQPKTSSETLPEEADYESRNEWEDFNDKELFERISEEMRLEAQSEAMDYEMQWER